MEGFGGSVAGGGRYDKMIGKFTGVDTPACGFSIGFERIVLLLEERGANKPQQRGVAVLVDKSISPKQLADVYDSCRQMRKSSAVTVLKKAKNFGYQLKQLFEQGYAEIYEFDGAGFRKID